MAVLEPPLALALADLRNHVPTSSLGSHSVLTRFSLGSHSVLTRFSLGSPVFSLGRPVVLAGCDVSERLCRGVHRGRAVCERVWRGPRYWTVRMVDSLIERFAARHGTGDIDSPRRFSPAIPPTTGFTEDGSTRTRQSRMSARSSGVGSILRTLWISSR